MNNNYNFIIMVLHLHLEQIHKSKHLKWMPNIISGKSRIYSNLDSNSKFWILSSDKLMLNMSSHKRVVMFCFLGGSAIKLWQVWPNCNVLCIHGISKQQITAFHFTTNYKNKHCKILCFNNLFYYSFQFYKSILLMKKVDQYHKSHKS